MVIGERPRGRLQCTRLPERSRRVIAASPASLALDELDLLLDVRRLKSDFRCQTNAHQPMPQRLERPGVQLGDRPMAESHRS